MATRLVSALVVSVALCLSPAAVLAVGGGGGGGGAGGSVASPANPLEAQYAEGVAAVKGKDYHLAIFHLFKVVEQDPNNADALNWLGYSYRKIGDLDNALRHYEMALAIDPDHKGAHEYIGEAYLEAGKPAKAEEHLAALTRLCPQGCEELEDLKEFLAAYSARS